MKPEEGAAHEGSSGIAARPPDQAAEVDDERDKRLCREHERRIGLSQVSGRLADDRSLTAYAEARTLKRWYEEISERYPRQCGAMRRSIESSER